MPKISKQLHDVIWGNLQVQKELKNQGSWWMETKIALRLKTGDQKQHATQLQVPLKYLQLSGKNLVYLRRSYAYFFDWGLDY